MKIGNKPFAIVICCIIVAVLTLPAVSLAGSLDPSAPPAPTMRTLEQLKPAWDKVISGAQRFAPALEPDAQGNPVAYLDKETGLVWAADAKPFYGAWQAAKDYCTTLNLGGRMGWRMPTIEELATLVDQSQANPALPSGHPFSIQNGAHYWSSSNYSTSYAWYVYINDGHLGGWALGNESNNVWPVRSGQ